MKKYLWLLLMLPALGAEAQWILTQEGIQYTAGKVGVGLGTAAFNARLGVGNTTTAGVKSHSSIYAFRSTQGGSNSITSEDSAIKAVFQQYDIPAGGIDFGTKHGLDIRAFSLHLGFAGTLDRNAGVWSQAGIFNSQPSAKINKVYGVYSECLSRNGTIENSYGVYIKSDVGPNGLIINKYDLYASTSDAKNYIAGKLGIGGTDTEVFPLDYMLTVAGKGLLEEVKVLPTNEWPDYVFDTDYELSSLDSIQQYISKEGHLPGIPSATEVSEAGGIELGEMNRKLLEKIEELTLHLIDQNEKLKQHEVLIEALHTKLNEAKK